MPSKRLLIKSAPTIIASNQNEVSQTNFAKYENERKELLMDLRTVVMWQVLDNSGNAAGPPFKYTEKALAEQKAAELTAAYIKKNHGLESRSTYYVVPIKKVMYQ